MFSPPSEGHGAKIIKKGESDVDLPIFDSAIEAPSQLNPFLGSGTRSERSDPVPVPVAVAVAVPVPVPVRATGSGTGTGTGTVSGTGIRNGY